MSASALSSRKSEAVSTPLRGSPAPCSSPARMVRCEEAPGSQGPAETAYIDLGDSARLAVMLNATPGASFSEQVRELLIKLERKLATQPHRMQVTVQTIYLHQAEDQAECERILTRHFGRECPVTNYVLQPPCGGAALALEAWAIGGDDVRTERFGNCALAFSYDHVRWVSCGGISCADHSEGVYRQAIQVLEGMQSALSAAGSSLEHAVRTWFYLGGITDTEADTQRYKELNRARTDFYRNIGFCTSLLEPNIPHGVYPASTGIGMRGRGLVGSVLTLQTSRKDAFLLPLENPQQTPAYAYHPRYSPQSPKFSRAMSLVMGNYVTTWISGTASIVNSESKHLGDIEKQTEQTIDNIERLISPANFAFHGVKGAGASLSDLAKLRVYLKRGEDYEKCRAICERRFGTVPAIHAIADVCRPELLVEIEGVSFSRRMPVPNTPPTEAAPGGR